jgi:protein TonB
MNQNTILQSNLLDIIFENRNKEYGAYNLRKSYNNRIRVALLSALALSLSLCFLFTGTSTTVSNMRNTIVSIPDGTILDYQPPSKPEHKAAENNIHPKKTNQIELPPKIVDSVNINKSTATVIGTMSSLNSTDTSEMNSA